MMQLLRVFAVVLAARGFVSAQVLGLINVPPISPLGQPPNTGNALAPKYQTSRQVTLVSTGQQQTVEQPSTEVATAIYTMSNAASGNILYAIPIGKDGMINASQAIKQYSTNGKGIRFPFTGKTVQDALDSQGSVVQAGARIFAVNAGSNTLQEFAVNCSFPTLLTTIGGAVSTHGTNPSTLAVAPSNHIVCVANTGSTSNIACFTYDSGFGSTEVNGPQIITGGTASLYLPKAQTSPPTGPSDTVSQLLFTDDESTLIAIVKGAVGTNGVATGGFINAYPITSTGLGTPVTSKPSGTSLLFGCTLQYNTKNLFCSDAAVGAVFLTPTGPNNTYIKQSDTPASSFGGGMNCWAARSPYANGPDYVTAVDKNYIAAFKNNAATLINGPFSQYNFTNGNPNLIEMAIGNSVIYALSFGNSSFAPHITVARDTSLSGSLVQLQNYAVPQASYNISGMAAFIPDDPPNVCNF